MMNQGLTILESQVRMAVVAAGLDPTIGFFTGGMEVSGPLVLGLMEPIRPVGDRVALGFARAHTFSPRDVTLTDDGVCRLNPQLARNIAALVSKQLEASGPPVAFLSFTI